MTQVYSASRLGGAMDWDSEGNLYIATGDTIDGATNAYRGGYTNAHPEHTVPGTGAEVTISDARGTAANTKAYEGKVLRITPLADPGPVPGLDKTYTIPGADAPNGPNLFPLDDKLSKPEIFAMGVSDVRSLDIDPKTDTISAAWTGTEQQNNSVQWGPAKTESAARITGAGNYGWPYCAAGNRFSYRATLPAIGGGGAANLGWPDTPRGTVRGGADIDDGAPSAFWKCSSTDQIPNDSPFNTGRALIPAPQPVNVWYGPQGGCYDFPRNANGVARLQRLEHQHRPGHRAPLPVGARRQPVRGERRHLPAPGAGQGRHVARLLGRPLVPRRLRGRRQRAPRAADGPGDRGRRAASPSRPTRCTGSSRPACSGPTG